MKTVREPLTRKQRAELEGIIANSTQVFRSLMFILFVTALAVFFRSLQNFVDLIEFPIWAVPTIGISSWLYLRSSRWTGGKKLRLEIRDDLKDGKAVVFVLEPESVVEIEELEDEGPSYIIHANDGAFYLLTGQDMARYKSKNFPWEKFGVVQTPHSKRFLGLRKMGSPMPVSDKREPLSYNLAKELGCFTSSFIVLDEAKMQLLSDA